MSQVGGEGQLGGGGGATSTSPRRASNLAFVPSSSNSLQLPPATSMTAGGIISGGGTPRLSPLRQISLAVAISCLPQLQGAGGNGDSTVAATSGSSPHNSAPQLHVQWAGGGGGPSATSSSPRHSAPLHQLPSEPAAGAADGSNSPRAACATAVVEGAGVLSSFLSSRGGGVGRGGGGRGGGEKHHLASSSLG